MKYKAPEFINSFKMHDPSNVYYLIGEDHFLADRIIQLLLRRFTSKDSSEFDFINLSASNCKSADIIEQLEMFPFLAEYRVILVRSFELLREPEKLKVADYISNIPETSILIIHCEKQDGRSSTARKFSKFTVIETNPPAGYWEIEKWLQSELRKLNIRANRDAISLFASKIEADYYTAYNELQKILIYIGKSSTIKVEDIQTCMKDNRANTIFELQNALGARNIKVSLQVLIKLLESEESKNSPFVVVMLTRFFQKIWKVKYLLSKGVSQQEIASNYLADVYIKFRKDYINFAWNYKDKKMQEIFDYLLETDLKLKSTDLDPKLLLSKMLVNIVTK